MLKNFALLQFLLLLAPTAEATSKKITLVDTRCAATTLEEVEKILLDYNGYKNMPGTLMKLEIPHFGDVRLLEMVKSQGKIFSQDTIASDAAAWFVLRPTTIADSTLYPRFLLRCQTSKEAGKTFAHRCSMDSTKEHFGIDDFQSQFKAVNGSPSCKSGEIGVQFQVSILSNVEDVAAIKRKVLGPLSSTLSALVSPFFNEESFFKSYYEGVYEGWLKSR